MTTTNHGGGPAGDRAFEEIDALWEQFEDNLAAYLSAMTDPNDGDHLRIELADPDPEGDAGCPPYVQFAAFGDGVMVRAEISGNAYLLAQYQLGEDGCAFLRDAGWVGNVMGGDIEDRNWVMDRPIEGGSGVGEIANHVVWALRYHFGIAHPQLLTYDAWGPAADGATVLGLCASDGIPVEESLDGAPAAMDAVRIPLVVEPSDRAELLAAVGRVLRKKYEAEPFLDDDEDFVLHHMDQPVWVRVRADQPAVEIMARVAHDVYSRRATAVEIGLLNRDNLWAHWTLRDRIVWQTLVLPGLPFVPSHLDAMLDLLLEAMTATRDDLAYRTGAKAV